MIKPVLESQGKPPVGDRLFAAPRERIQDFDFGGDTAVVFDDMLERSVPYYDEIQRMVGELASDFAAPGKCVYDLGCSTGTTLLHIARAVPQDVPLKFVGIDSSPEMLELARQKLGRATLTQPFELRHSDLNHGVRIDDACVVMLILTLQFIRPLYRESLMRSIHEGLADRGCLILVEKVLGQDSTLNRLFIQHHYEMKRGRGYSELEISQKREALENVLVPYRLEENRDLLRKVGFSAVDVFFKWYNFCGIVAIR